MVKFLVMVKNLLGYMNSYSYFQIIFMQNICILYIFILLLFAFVYCKFLSFIYENKKHFNYT